MTTIAFLIALYALLGGLVVVARRDHFAGPGSVAESHDELGSLDLRARLVPRP